MSCKHIKYRLYSRYFVFISFYEAVKMFSVLFCIPVVVDADKQQITYIVMQSGSVVLLLYGSRSSETSVEL